MKILWLCQYPIKLLIPELQIIRNKDSHSSSWIVNLSKALGNEDYIELHILTSSAHIPFTQTIKKLGITFHVVKYSLPFFRRGFPEIFPYDSLTWYHGFINKGLKIIKEIKPDLIHAHGIEKGFSLLALKSGIKNVTSIQGSLLLCFKYTPSFKSFAQIPIEKYCLKNNHNFGCRTNWDKDLVISINSNAKVYYMPENIGTIYFTKTWQPDNKHTLVFVGSVIKRKGVEILIAAIKKVRLKIPNIKVKLIGGYSKKYQKYLINIIDKLQLSKNIEFLGRRDSEEIAEILSKSTAFVLPTLIDNSPNSLAEAMAVGMPCVASNVGGIPSIIDDGKNGVLFTSENSDILAYKIINTLSNKELMNKISKEAKKTAYEKNYNDNVVKQTIKVYKEIINN